MISPPDRPSRPDESSPVLVLGATGHLGQAVVRGLLRHGYRVRGLARKPSAITRALPEAHWVYAGLKNLRSPADWKPMLENCRAVVNLAGALQDSSRDRLDDIHGAAIEALAAALPPTCRIVHISAPGVSQTASTEFYRTKARGDVAVRQSGRDYVVFRPAVVLSPEACGGSALLRALAAFPWAIPVLHPESAMQTVALADVISAVRSAIAGDIPPGSDMILAEAQSHTLGQVLLAYRQWLGLRPAPVVSIPSWLGAVLARSADLAGYAGWRSPLRSTALQVAAEGVTGASGQACRSLEDTLAAYPATVQERWFARLYLLKALGIVVVALFWLASGTIGLLRAHEAAAILAAAGFGGGSAMALVNVGSLADLALGLLVLFRRTMPAALIGMFLVSIFYLAAGTLFTPSLWLDPLGPLLKSIPAAILALFLLAIAPER